MKIIRTLAASLLLTVSLSACVSNMTPAPDANTGTDNQGTIVPVEDMSWIAHKVFLNETSGNYDHLVFWSPKEDFLSLGIAHFIWYPTGREGRYTETFPSLIEYLSERAEPVPEWLKAQAKLGAPWFYREQFLNARYSAQVRELHDLMSRTMNLQANFMADRLRKALPEMTSHIDASQRDRIIARYRAVEQSHRGMYPLLDYVNFKGEGISPTEQYQGQGWGLLQVLQEMRDVPAGEAALNEFARAAEQVLRRRVYNSPRERNEDRFLPGWMNRINSYRSTQLWQG